MNSREGFLGYWAQSLKRDRWQPFVYLSESHHLADSDQEPGNSPQITDLSKNDLSPNTLANTQPGDRVCIVALNCGESNNRLMAMGLMPNSVLEVVSRTATGSVIVALHDQRLGLGAEMARQIQVVNSPRQLGINSDNPTTEMINMQSAIKLRDVAIGSTLKVVGYEPTNRDYKRKLLAMGLTPGTELTVKRHAPLGDPTEIEVRGFHLSLRKVEADALIVEPVSGVTP